MLFWRSYIQHVSATRRLTAIAAKVQKNHSKNGEQNAAPSCHHMSLGSSGHVDLVVDDAGSGAIWQDSVRVSIVFVDGRSRIVLSGNIKMIAFGKSVKNSDFGDQLGMRMRLWSLTKDFGRDDAFRECGGIWLARGHME